MRRNLRMQNKKQTKNSIERIIKDPTYTIYSKGGAVKRMMKKGGAVKKNTTKKTMTVAQLRAEAKKKGMKLVKA